MAIITAVVSAAVVYAVFHKKINRFTKSVVAGVKEFVKIATRSMRK